MAGRGRAAQKAARHRQPGRLLTRTVALGVLSACTDAPGFGPNRHNEYVVESSPAGEVPLDVVDLVHVDDSLIALASAVDAPGSVILRSDDGGEGWQHP